MSKHNLATKESRRRLHVRREPYWQDLGDGCGLGFRRGPDTWVARWHNPGDGKHLYRALKEATDFADARKLADAWWKTMSGGTVATVKRGTVLDALNAYVASKREHGRDADDIERRIKLTVEGKPIASLKLEQLSQAAFAAWRTELRKGRANRTTNREVRAIVAGLTWSVKRGGYTGNPLAWDIEPLADDADDEPEAVAVFVNPAQRAALIAAAGDDAVALFLRGLEATGARPGELAAATAADFDGTRLTLRTRKGGKLRVRSIEMSSAGVAFIKAQCRDKLPAAPIFTHTLSGTHWQRHQWAAAIRYFVGQANKKLKGPARIPAKASAYSFRHASIAELLPVLDPVTVAKHHGTSIAMLERTYHKFIPGTVAAALDGLRVAT